MDVVVTSNAARKIKDLLSENKEERGLRVFVQGGGCAGFQYGFCFERELQEDDFTVEQEGVTLYVDSMSAQYLHGSTIDYKEELMGASFTISNPNAVSTCGCGSSFAA